ncbi:MAG: hypothetical protein IPM32_05065 [Ignavibacteriae bacterium]|nr:hypothetical protein [Ignavibacteriota bacterium]
MNIIYKILFIAFFLLGVNKIYSQSKLERDYYKTVNNVEVIDNKLDSLNKLLSHKLSLINIEKSKSSQNNSVIENLLSSTSTITNKIEKYETEKNKILQYQNKLKNDLGTYYEIQIDSLKKENGEKNFLKIIELSERKLLVAEEIDLLSVNPEKIDKIKSEKNSEKRKIYNEFLNFAKNEVDNKITKIAILKSEIENIIKLNKEKDEFLDEIAFNSRMMKSSTKNLQNTESASYDVENSPTRDVIKNYSISINGILTQLEFGKISDDNFLSSKNSKESFSSTTNFNDLLKLISKAEKELKEYKNVIFNKIKNL